MMIDARCRRCGQRWGWSGDILHAPPCPRCGHAIPAEDLEHDSQEIESFRQLLKERPARTGAGSYWARARFAAGLTHGQAARLLRVRLDEMFAITNGDADPLPWLADRMREVYGLDPLPDA